MKRIISLFLIFIATISFVSCSKAEKVEKIEVVRNQQPLTAQKIELPLELQGYKYVYLKSFDGQYAVFTVEREETIGDDSFAGDTGRIAVYDVLTEKVVHLVNLNMPGFKVGSAVKQGENLYFTAYNRVDFTEYVNVNNGLGNIAIDADSIDESYNYSRLYKDGDNIFLIKSKGEIGNTEYDIFLLNGNSFDSVCGFEPTGNIIEFRGLENGQPVIYETDISDEENIYFNVYKGDEKKTIFSLKNEHTHSFVQLENMFIHPVDSLDNENAYKMMAVTDLESKNVTEIGMMQGGFLGNFENKGIMCTYGKSREQVCLYEAKDGVLEITPVDIDVTGMNNQSYYMTKNNALMSIGKISLEGADLIEGDKHWYLLEY